MPKMKTHRGAAKRFKKTGTGKIIRMHGYTSHMLEKKSPKSKRNLRTIDCDAQKLMQNGLRI